MTKDDKRESVLRELNSDPFRQVPASTILGFFHPYCNAGGGGERVLWTAVRDVQKEFPHVISVIYTGDLDATKEQILYKVKVNFNIDLDPHKIIFVYLTTRYLVDDSRYPRFTLALQSLASLVLGFEAVNKVVPDIYFDTMGYAFTYPFISFIAQVKIFAYVHYPTISSDMLQRVYEQRQTQEVQVSNKGWLWSTGKLIYYHLFAKAYGFCGSYADVVMVNSTWTKGHIDQLWSTDAQIVYPPCDTDRLNELPLKNRLPMIVSVAQFRPEKDHSMQLKAVAQLLEKYPQWKTCEGFELVLIGSSRNQGDEDRIQRLRQEVVSLGIDDYVRFEINASYDVLVSSLGKAKVGLHTMWNEHFGIGVVEYMAAGLIPVAHNSAGPKLDIVTDYAGKQTGYLADSVDGFASSLHAALSLSLEEYEAMASNARASASDRFSEVAFSSKFLRSLRRYFT
ncbi:glycosyltransferase family 4 protein [Phycomyces blakesleeanus NRRL 1555(-)]|uniref:GDP-Man:Man(3)GlcNAc(2)-PP-Dol alpha-1,2-mannosyltransferase n=2 Tax=Phycomyces blakesleeanus TaxID=4837 RepID=A0A162TD98_PHYB8|nr:glycosyltransferase family 4 protein [Phycomyces blakesleeanus NRRL 1555(-)]OAD67672.1 glycosyltransferase family 4 protein [Phycomyces blakesleeanus NRRL 1555(-)]|eukprot:XP_018285712.1 glycosyltransferase family 4 protein [Phycomyces blakesleeanus NRRL 1555(-)]